MLNTSIKVEYEIKIIEEEDGCRCAIITYATKRSMHNMVFTVAELTELNEMITAAINEEKLSRN